MEDQDECWDGTAHLLVFFIFLCVPLFWVVILMAVIEIVLKLLGFCDGWVALAVGPETVLETSGLLPKDMAAPVIIYGAVEEEDDEESEDLYEEHVCVICYDNKRSCFFVPCGHCATYYPCANRITEEARPCPFCRRIIHKVRTQKIV